MRFSVLGSGSKGNCTLVASGRTTILIDNGFSGKEITKRLELVGFSLQSLDAIVISHEHGDHIAGVGVLSRRCRIPVYANPATHAASAGRVKKLHARQEFGTGQSFCIGELNIHPFQVSHDTVDPVGFQISDGSRSIAYCTDTGKITKMIANHLRQCQALILEANHDPRMLREGPYPLPLQQRVKSSQGHLANEDAGRCLRELLDSGLQHVVLAHLSETNNLPELALETIRKELCLENSALQITISRQDAPTPLIEV